MNLIKNALKFTSKGSIKIKAVYNDELIASPELSVEITDTGVGFAAEDIDKLFTRFGKLQRTATINSEGLGLGLTIVKQIVDSAGGNVSAFSPGVGKGSTFSFSLPMDLVDEEQAPLQPKKKKKKASSNKLIFFDEIDDEEVGLDELVDLT